MYRAVGAGWARRLRPHLNAPICDKASKTPVCHLSGSARGPAAGHGLCYDGALKVEMKVGYAMWGHLSLSLTLPSLPSPPSSLSLALSPQLSLVSVVHWRNFRDLVWLSLCTDYHSCLVSILATTLSCRIWYSIRKWVELYEAYTTRATKTRVSPGFIIKLHAEPTQRGLAGGETVQSWNLMWLAGTLFLEHVIENLGRASYFSDEHMLSFS